MAVFDIQQETDVREPFVPVPMVDVMQDQNFERAEVGVARCGHAARNPSRKGVEPNDQAELEL